jgi:purine-binding chemotaxis protein CheW
MRRTSKTIDWDEVRRRVHESQLALERALNADAGRLEAVYRERADRLAGRRAQAGAPSGAVRVLSFLLGEERYALAFADLAELLPFDGGTPIPGGPAELLGVVNVHGEIRSVVDLGRLLALPGRQADRGGYVLLVRRAGREVALRVDGIERVELLAADQLAAPDDDLRLVAALGPGRLRLLDTDALLGHNVWQAG